MGKCHQTFTGTCGGEEARLYVLQLVKIVQRAQVARIKVWEPASPCRLLAHLPHRRGGGLWAAAVGGHVVALQGGEGAGGGLSVGEEGLQSHLLHRLQDAQASTFSLQPSLLPAQTNDKNSLYMIIDTRGLQRDVVYLGWPIAPSYMSQMRGGGSCGVSAKECNCSQEPK